MSLVEPDIPPPHFHPSSSSIILATSPSPVIDVSGLRLGFQAPPWERLQFSTEDASVRGPGQFVYKPLYARLISMAVPYPWLLIPALVIVVIEVGLGQTVLRKLP